ncbi:hypothetical protein B7H23_00990 [Notoacmeibacter marinus]|uniref:Uncharacterized protein n=2 Tax=Notoacmeibacter marinus TaxID=1876515 RepID=A0A231V084_9HYPH|nr:hypothetical protein B7H23_00990 [Notoacmeibacter marinus]
MSESRLMTTDSDHIVHRADIDALFDTYRNGFDDFDAEAIADCFTFPVTIWQFGKGNIFQDADDLLDNIEALLDVLGKEEIASSDFAIHACEMVGATAFVSVEWVQSRADGEEAWRFACHYTLILDSDDVPAIAMIVNA